jgi:ATP-dependent 26S proteasome regulatory subunit
MAATNLPDILDPALTRPGRFDRHVSHLSIYFPDLDEVLSPKSSIQCSGKKV